MTRATFISYLKHCLARSLRRGAIVIMENLPAHKGVAVKKAVETAHAKLIYLPKYSPDLNPIEQAFSKLKALLRKAAERTILLLWRRIGKLLADFSATKVLCELAPGPSPRERANKKGRNPRRDAARVIRRKRRHRCHRRKRRASAANLICRSV